MLPNISGGYAGVLGLSPVDDEAYDGPTVLEILVTEGVIDTPKATFVLNQSSDDSIKSYLVLGSAGAPEGTTKGDSGSVKLDSSSETWNLTMEGI